MKKPEVYIHTGMGRTGSTFLQHQVFPKFRGIFYKRHTKFRKAEKIIQKGRYERYLVSGEMEYKKLDRHMREFSALFPGARPIIIMRRQDEWVASQYRRFVKSGYAFTFNAFFTPKNDSGFWEREWLRYMGNIEILEKYFENKPLVLFYDELRKNPEQFIRQLADYTGAEVNMNKINLSPRHTSYNEKQLRVIYTLGKKVSMVKRKPSASKTINVFLNLGRNILRYTTLFFAPLIPNSWLSKDIFLPEPGQLAAVKKYFSKDWEECREYAKQNN